MSAGASGVRNLDESEISMKAQGNTLTQTLLSAEQERAVAVDNYIQRVELIQNRRRYCAPIICTRSCVKHYACAALCLALIGVVGILVKKYA